MKRKGFVHLVVDWPGILDKGRMQYDTPERTFTLNRIDTAEILHKLAMS